MDSSKAETKITREALLAEGFKESTNNPGTFVAENVRLASIAVDLGFERAQLQTVPGQSRHSDIRRVIVRGVPIVVESEVKDANGAVVERSLDEPNPICNVIVQLQGYAEPRYATTESVPSLRIVDVAQESEGSRRTLRVTFEIDAVGRTPVGISQSEVALDLKGVDGPRRLIGRSVTFANGTPEVLTVSPGRPRVVTVSKSGTYEDPLGRRRDLPGGRYLLDIAVSARSKQQEFDYHWIGETHSDSREVVIK